MKALTLSALLLSLGCVAAPQPTIEVFHVSRACPTLRMQELGTRPPNGYSLPAHSNEERFFIFKYLGPDKKISALAAAGISNLYVGLFGDAHNYAHARKMLSACEMPMPVEHQDLWMQDFRKYAKK